MVPQESLLALLVRLIDQIPMPAPPKKRGRGRPRIYTDRLFLKALVIMIVRRLHQVHELLSVLEQPTTQMQTLRASLMQNGRYPTRKPLIEDWQHFPRRCQHRLAAWDATWWR